MHWIKGFDRIIFVSSILVFFVTSVFIYPQTVDIIRLTDLNPEYQAWYKEYGEKYEENIKSGVFSLYNPDDVNIPPEYLPVKVHKRLIATAIISLIYSLLWLIGLAAITRMIKLSIKPISFTMEWLLNGFKN